MSLAERYETARIVAKIPPKILTLDIERLPGQAVVQHRGLTISGDFWDLNSWKHTIGYRIHPDNVTAWPRTICLAWRWYGAKKVHFAAEWDEGGHEAMLRKAWDLYNEADICVGHNLAGFDSKKLVAEWQTHGWPPPSPWKTVDTLTAARARAGHESNTLDALLKRFGIQGKTDKYSVELARTACAGDVKAQRRLKGYNVGDIHASEALYDHLRPWMTNHPHIGLWSGDETCCGACGGELKPSDWCRTAVTAYAQYVCTNCGAWYRRNEIKARTTTRPAR